MMFCMSVSTTQFMLDVEPDYLGIIVKTCCSSTSNPRRELKGSASGGVSSSVEDVAELETILVGNLEIAGQCALGVSSSPRHICTHSSREQMSVKLLFLFLPESNIRLCGFETERCDYSLMLLDGLVQTGTPPFTWESTRDIITIG